MARKSKPLNKRITPGPVEKTTVAKPTRKSSWLISNLLGLFAVCVLIFGIILKQDCYGWVKDMLLENHTFIQSNQDLSIRERLGAKLGVSYNLFDSIRSDTPDTAIIYIPDKNAFFPPGVNSIFRGNPYNKLWAIRFLYPRKVVIPSEMGKTEYAEKISHVTIIYGKGVELLRYKLPTPIDFGILSRDSLILRKE